MRHFRRLFVLFALVAGLLAALPTSPASAADRNFSVRFTANDTGDIDIVGNTVMTCPTAANGCTAARSAAASAAANSNVNNNSFAMEYVDVDSDATTFNSSRSTLSLPAGATVLFAGLYWGGEVAAGNGGSAAPNAAARNTIKFQAPGDASYSTITASTVDDGAIIYQGFANVTARVAAAGSGTYTAANLQTATGGDRLGGWSLVVAYRDTAQPARNLTVFDGLKSIGSGASGTIAVSGFQTPPAGAVNATLGFVTYEGDLGLVGDTATLNGKALSDPQHPATNFFDSRSSRNGVLRTGNTPGYDNNLGFEQSMLSVDNNYIANGATSATIGLTSSGDVYAPGVVTVATELYAPRVNQTKTVTDLNGGLLEQGDTLRYTISGSNDGQDGAASFVLRDPIPADTTYKPGTIKVTQPAGPVVNATDAALDDVAERDAVNDRIVARIGTGASATAGGLLSPGKTYTVVFDVVVDGPAPAVPDTTTITNTATASYSSQSLGTALTSVSTATIKVAGPDLAVTKTHTGTLVQGTEATYTLGVKNVGPAKSQGPVTVTDALPAGLTYVAAAGTGWSCSQAAGTLTCTRTDSLAPGAAYPPISLTVRVTDTAPATVANTVTVAGGGDAPDDNNSAVDSAPTVAITDLSVTKTPDSATVAVGGTVTYSLKITNNGPSRSTGSTVVDTLPAGMGYVSASQGCTSQPSASTVTCAVGALASGASTTVQVTTRPDLGTAGRTLTNSVTVLADQTDPTPGNNTATSSVQVRPVDLAITSQIVGNPSTLTPGTTYTWQLGVSNLGTSPAADTSVRFTVPTGLTVVPGSLDPRCALDGTDVVCELGTVGPGAQVPTIEVQATVASGAAAPASVDTLAVVRTSEPEVDLTNNAAPTSTPVTASVDLAVTIAATPTSVAGGDTLTLTATVSNLGAATPTAPVATIVIPDGTTYVSAAPGCTYDAGTRTVTCTLPPGDLDPGESLTRAVVVTVDAGPTGPLTATSTVSSDSADVDLTNNTASVSVPVLTTAGLSITKTVDRPQAAPGSTVTYTLSVTNAGPAGADDVVVTDTLPAGTTLVSTSGGTCSNVGPAVTCALGTVAAGSTRVVTITATVDPVVAAPGAGGHQLDVTKVESNLALPASAEGTASAQCPAGYLATDGSVRIDAVDQGTGTLASPVVLRSSATADGTGWTGTVRNTATGQAQVKVIVVCSSTSTTVVAGHSHPLVVSPPVTTATSWTAGTWTADLDCGPGRVAVAPGFTFTSGAGQVRASERNGTGWQFVVDVAEAATATFDIRCLSTSVGTTAGHSHDLGLVQLSDTVVVPPGQTVEAVLTCGEQSKGIVASYDVDPGLVPLGSDPQPKTRVFRFFNPTTTPLTARIGLLCLDTRTGDEVTVSAITNTASVATSTPDATTDDDSSSATFSLTTAPGPVAPRFSSGPVARVVGAGTRTRLSLPVSTSRTHSYRVRVLATSAVRGTPLRSGALLATKLVRVAQGRHAVVLRVVPRAAPAVGAGRVVRAKVVVTARDGSRETRIIRLRG